MATNSGGKNVVTTGSGHATPPVPELSKLPAAPPPTAPFPVFCKSSAGKGTSGKLTCNDKEVLTEDSFMPVEAPANGASAGDVQSSALKGVGVVRSGASRLISSGKKVACTAEMVAINVLAAPNKVAQASAPLLGAGGGGGGGGDGGGDTSADAGKVATVPAQTATETGAPGAVSAPEGAASSEAGDPVAVISGRVVDDKTDLLLPGAFALGWKRSYSSARNLEDGLLGKGGWALWCDQHIRVIGKAISLRSDDGRDIHFERIGDDESTFHRGERLDLQRYEGNRYRIVSAKTRLIRDFAPVDEAPGGRARLTAISDTSGNRITLSYEDGRLSQVVDTAGRQWFLRYDDASRIGRVEIWAAAPVLPGEQPQAASLQTWFDYAYDAAGCLCRATDALGHYETYSYDVERRRISIRWKNGTHFYYRYDPNTGLCIKTWGDSGIHTADIEHRDGIEVVTTGGPDARRYVGTEDGFTLLEEATDGSTKTEREYDQDRLLLSFTNGAGETTSQQFDERANLIAVTDPAGNTTEWTFEHGRLVAERQPGGLESQFGYDDYGRLRSASYPDGRSYSIDVDGLGRTTALYGKSGLIGSYGYDSHHNLVEQATGLGARTQFRYDALGNAVERIDAFGNRTTAEFDAMCRAIRITYSDGTSASWTFNPLGNVTSHTTPLGETSTMRYAGTGSLVEFVERGGQRWHFGYDSAERLRTVENPRRERYEYRYDRAGNVLEERTFDGRRIRYSYDLATRLHRVENPDGTWRELSYDPLGNVLADHGPDVVRTFERDAQGRVVRAEAASATGNAVTEFERDDLGRITAEIQDGQRIAYELNELSRPTSRTLPDGTTTRYRYDDFASLKSVEHGGYTMQLEHDVVGRRVGRSAPGVEEQLSYDAFSGLESHKIVVPDPGGAAPRVLNERRYSFDAARRLTGAADSQRGDTVYGYDPLNRLIEAHRGGSQEIFDYDVTGSVQNALDELGSADKTQPWTVEPGNVLRERPHVRYEYDDCKRRIAKHETVDDGAEAVTRYGWDSLGQLTEVWLSDDRIVRYGYDAFGRRTRKTVHDGTETSATTEYLYDGQALCAEQMPGGHQRVHVHQPRTFVPLLQSEGGQTFAVITDHNGVPTDLIDVEGRRAWSATHSVWGKVVDVVRDEGALAVESPFRMLGQLHDDETGLCYNRFRYFDPDAARFCSPDPVGLYGGVNLASLNGAPTMTQDPFGLACPNRPQYKQEEDNSCGPCAVRMVLATDGVEVSEAALRAQSAGLSGGYDKDEGTFPRAIAEQLRMHGQNGTKKWSQSISDLESSTSGGAPAIAMVEHAPRPNGEPGGAHYVVVDSVTTGPDGTRTINIRDPDGNTRSMSEHQFQNDYYGDGTNTKYNGWVVDTS